MKMFVISESQLRALAVYLAKLPYEQVYQFITMIQELKEHKQTESDSK